MNIRDATANDQPEIKALIFSVLREYGLKPDPATTDMDLDDIEAHYTRRGGYFGVVTEEGAVVATLAIFRVDDDNCELRKMYSVPAFRGRGKGRQLLTYSLNKAREMGFKRITLETASPLVEAIGLYQQFGFTEFQPEHKATRCDKAFELML